MTPVGSFYPHRANKCLLLKPTLTFSPSWSKPAVCWPLQLHNQRTRAECRGSEAWGFHVPITGRKWSWSCTSYKIISHKQRIPYGETGMRNELCGLFQVLRQWGRSKTRVGDERGLGEKRRGPFRLLYRTVLVAHPLFRSSQLTESLERARNCAVHLGR